jgi:hypothetical protein
MTCQCNRLRECTVYLRQDHDNLSVRHQEFTARFNPSTVSTVFICLVPKIDLAQNTVSVIKVYLCVCILYLPGYVNKTYSWLQQ